MKNISLFAMALISIVLISGPPSPALADVEMLVQSEGHSSERIQLHELWKAYIKRNPDIQFVVRVLHRDEPEHDADC